jgi:hypothetical protein
MIRIIALLVVVQVASAQKFEVKEITGTVKGFEPGWGLAYEHLVLEVAGIEESYSFPPFYAKMILDKIKPGDQITIQANVYPKNKDIDEAKYRRYKRFFNWDAIVSIKKGEDLIEFTSTIVPRIDRTSGLFFNKVIRGEYFYEGRKLAFIFDDGLIGYRWFPTKNDYKKGDAVSFIGFKWTHQDGYQYPLEGVKSVYAFNPMLRDEGVIKSFLFKQNYVCIGMVIKSRQHGELKVSFPSNYAEEIQRFANEEKVTVYFTDYNINDQLHPTELHAVIQNGDTLKILEHGFYGGADIKHEHKPATIEGKITAINRIESGRIINFIIGNDCYIEIDAGVERKLKSYFKRGQLLQVDGEERIKAPGEVYSRDYRIITPRKFVIDGKTFLLNQLQ